MPLDMDILMDIMVLVHGVNTTQLIMHLVHILIIIHILETMIVLILFHSVCTKVEHNFGQAVILGIFIVTQIELLHGLELINLKIIGVREFHMIRLLWIIH